MHEAYETLAHRDDDQDERCNTQDDQQNVAIIQISCRIAEPSWLYQTKGTA